ncbi:MAG TPA: replicative DNA helicase [Candidatus Rifleibacterium sp.]|nr:replicative DNA helicase [Candidatus Rifleibacterium sp.]
MSDVFHKVPPHSLEAEQSVLGSMMLSEEAVATALEIVEAIDFYQAAHRHIFQSLIDLFNSQRPCDLITIQEELRSKERLAEVGGVSYLSQLLNVVPTSRNAQHYARIVKDKSMLRHLISLSGELSTSAYDPQAQADLLMSEAEQKVLQLSQFQRTKPYMRVKDLVKPTFTYLESLYENKQAVTGVPSGFTRLDEYTAGFQKSDLIIIAARPSMGKTAFCLNIAQNAAYHGNTPVMLFSLEMSHMQLVTRLLCAEARIDGSKVRRGFLGDEDWVKLSHAAGALEQTPILIDDTANASMLEIRSKARRAFAQDKIGMIIIDYLQLISWSGSEKPESRQQEVSAISRSLKGLARELNIPVICLSQLSRAVESRTDRRPVLSDLRESGAIEQDADVVMFLYRDWYYSKKEESKGKGEVIIAKQRNGPVGGLELAFNENFARFDNLETVYSEY